MVANRYRARPRPHLGARDGNCPVSSWENGVQGSLRSSVTTPPSSSDPDQVTRPGILGRQNEGGGEEMGDLTELSFGADDAGVSCYVTCAQSLKPVSDMRESGVVTAHLQHLR